MPKSYLQTKVVPGRSMRQIASGLSTWAAAAVFAYYVIRHYRGDQRKVDFRTIAKDDAAEFEMLQAKTNATVKAADRARAGQSDERTSMLHTAARAQHDERDVDLDYMTDYKNTVNPNGVVTPEMTNDARDLQRWMNKHGNADFKDELSKLKESFKEQRKA